MARLDPTVTSPVLYTTTAKVSRLRNATTPRTEAATLAPVGQSATLLLVFVGCGGKEQATFEARSGLTT
jgi:hypothetical protein